MLSILSKIRKAGSASHTARLRVSSVEGQSMTTALTVIIKVLLLRVDHAVNGISNENGRGGAGEMQIWNVQNLKPHSSKYCGPWEWLCVSSSNMGFSGSRGNVPY